MSAAKALCRCGHEMFWHGEEHYGCLGAIDRCDCQPVTVCLKCDCGQAEARRRLDGGAPASIQGRPGGG